MALLPLGRAWQSHGRAEQLYVDAAFEAGAFEAGAFETETRPGTILYRYWSALGAVRNFVERRLCDLRREFFCASVVETRDLWMAEYGLPDACDPFPDLCTKVAAIGGARCDYYQAVAARAGWLITCDDLVFRCAGALAGRALAGRGKAGSSPRALCRMRITVLLGDSPAFTGRLHRRPLAGRLRAGQRLHCPPDLTPLRCLIERVAQAHVIVEYQTVN